MTTTAPQVTVVEDSLFVNGERKGRIWSFTRKDNRPDQFVFYVVHNILNGTVIFHREDRIIGTADSDFADLDVDSIVPGTGPVQHMDSAQITAEEFSQFVNEFYGKTALAGHIDSLAACEVISA